MASRRQIEGMAKKKEQEIQELEAKIKDAKIYLQALQDVLKKFPKDATDKIAPESVLRPGSMVAQAREAILAIGKPMHVDEILRATDKELSRGNRTALGGSISAYVRKGIIFTRVGPNTFGLVELEKDQTEPPEGFGIDGANQDDSDEIPF